MFRRAKKELSKGQACSSVKTISRILYISTTTKPFTSIDPSVNRTSIEAEQFSFSRNRNIFKAKRSEEKERERRKGERNIVRNDVLPLSEDAIVRRFGMAELGIGSFHEGSSFVEKFRGLLQVGPPIKNRWKKIFFLKI